jgi:hypothetical protein
MPEPGPLLHAALHYAARGVPIVPLFEPDPRGGCSCGNPQCSRPGKHPRNRGGLTTASTDPRVITDWWRRWPTANLGGRTGIVFDACDIDGPQGEAAVRPLLAAGHGRAALMRTGSGGWHLLFHPTGLGNRTKFLPDVDWRGTGGYIVLPPSLHISGNRYTILRPLTGALPAVPPALRQALDPAPAATIHRNPHAPVARQSGYAQAALDRETQRVKTAPKGKRNDTLNRAAFNLGQLIAVGQLTETDVTDALTDAALHANLSEHETARTITSGLTAGQRHPRPQRRAA